jgi:hypothetical protein
MTALNTNIEKRGVLSPVKLVVILKLNLSTYRGQGGEERTVGSATEALWFFLMCHCDSHLLFATQIMMMTVLLMVTLMKSLRKKTTVCTFGKSEMRKIVELLHFHSFTNTFHLANINITQITHCVVIMFCSFRTTSQNILLNCYKQYIPFHVTSIRKQVAWLCTSPQ